MGNRPVSLFCKFEGRLHFRPSRCKPLKCRDYCRPPLGTILQIVSQYQSVVFGARDEGRLFVREPFGSLFGFP